MFKVSNKETRTTPMASLEQSEQLKLSPSKKSATANKFHKS